MSKRFQIFKQPSVSIDKYLVIVKDGDDLLSVEEVVDVLNKQSNRIMLLEDNLLAMNMVNGNLEGALKCMEKEIGELKNEKEELQITLCNEMNEKEGLLEKSKKQSKEIGEYLRRERSWKKIHCSNPESNNCGLVIAQQDKVTALEEENKKLKVLLKNADRQAEIGRSYVQQYCSPQQEINYSKRIDNVQNQLTEELGNDYLTLACKYL